MAPPRILSLRSGAMSRTALASALALAALASSLSLAAGPLPADSRHAQYEPGPPYVGAPLFGNLLRDAEVSASGQTGIQFPAFANCGRHDSTPDHWAYAMLPAWINFKMPELRPVREIRIWFPPSGGPRTYQLLVEGSTYNKDWRTLADLRANKVPSTLAPLVLTLPKAELVRYVRVTVTGSSKPEEGARIWQVEAFARPIALPIEGAVGRTDRRYDGASLPFGGGDAWSSVAWRGERVSGQFVVWSSGERDELRVNAGPLRGPGGTILPAGAEKTFFVRHVLADGKYTGDILDPAPRLDMEAGTYRPIWLSIDVPRDAAPGRYVGDLTVVADDGGSKRFTLTLDVLPATIPPPSKWTFRMDIWQHPLAIAAWHGVEPWSDAHLLVMAPYMRMLADAGQKVVTTTITDRPWNRRDYTDYRSMVEHIREPDGTWRFDYGPFDRYVDYCASFGIDGQIDCVSLLTWGYQYSYTDAATGAERTINAAPESKEYADYWRPFLTDFEKHLKEKGWLGRACITMDEPSPEAVRSMAKLVREAAPHVHLCLAGNEPADKFADIDIKDFTIALYEAASETPADLARRRSEGRTTTYYPCMDPLRPNNFTNSPPAEGTWLGYFTAKAGFDGLERWAFTNWPRDPFQESLYSPVLGENALPPGDSFLVYPGPMSSIRWETLRAGEVEFEKLVWIRAHNGGVLPADLQKRLDTFSYPNGLGTDAELAAQVQAMRDAVNETAREIGKRIGTN
jgi:Domain of unknown function (DUF4091)